jgi:hypothetical protein
MEIIGREIEIGFSTEASRGVVESVVDKWQKNVTANIVERGTLTDDDATHGVLEDMDGRRLVQKYIEGDMEGIVHVDALGYFLSSIYGKVSSAVVTGSVYDHVFSLGQNIDHQSLTIFAKDGGVQQKALAGCMVGSLEINGAVDDYVRFTAGIVGQVATDDTATPSYDTEYDFIGRDIVIKIADSEAGLTSATAIKAKEITVAHDQGLIRDHVFGGYTPDDVYNAKQSIEGSFTLNFTDEDYKDLYLSDTEKYMSITITGEADLGGGENPSITYVFNKVMFNDWNRSGGNDELVTQPISFKAYYNTADGEASTVTLRNLTSAYANTPSN